LGLVILKNIKTLNLRTRILKIYLTSQSNFKSNKFYHKRISLLLISMVFQLYLFTGCVGFRKGNELTEFDNLQFSFGHSSDSKYFSVLITQSDTVFLKKYSGSNKDSLFYSIFPDSDRLILNKFVVSFDSASFHFSKPDSILGKFSLYIKFPDENDHFDFDGLPVPWAFKNFNSWINKIIGNLHFNLADTSINFKEDKNIHAAINK